MLRSPSWLLIPVVVALVSVAVVVSSPSKQRRQVMVAAVEWHEDLDAAIQSARRTGKDVLVNFTARRNCYACVLLKRQVLIQPEFLAYVGSRFVLVEIDKSMLEDDATKAAKLRRMEAWQFQYRAGRVPTVFLLDQAGRPYGITHHRDGGPVKFVEFLEKCRAARQQRDRLLSDAQSLSGPSRAAKLDEALEVVSQVLTDDVTLDEPPLMAFYATEINDILQLDASPETPFRQKYEQLQAELAEAQARNALSQKFDDIAESGGNDAAIKYADELLRETTDPSLRRRLKRYRGVYLEWADRFQEALAETRDQLRDPELTAEDRHRLEGRESYNLNRLGRRNEAQAIIDRGLIEAGDDRKRRRIALQDKGQFHFGKEWREAATAFETAANLSDDGSEEWWRNQALAAAALLHHKDHKAAKQAHAKLLSRADLAADFKLSVMLRLIESLLALGERAQAEGLRARFRQAIAECPNDLLAADDVKWLLSRCEQLFSETSNSDARLSSEQ
jgi:thioredoxin-related protein